MNEIRQKQVDEQWNVGRTTLLYNSKKELANDEESREKEEDVVVVVVVVEELCLCLGLQILEI